MRRRDFLKTTALAASQITAVRLSAAESLRPNLLFIMTDQQRWDGLSIAGNKIVSTPNLDRLACEGVFFKRAYTQCPVCAPARTSILTGRSLGNTGVRTNDDAKLTASSGACQSDTYDMILAMKGYWSEYHGKWHSPDFLTACYNNVTASSKGDGKYRLKDFYLYRKMLKKRFPEVPPDPGQQRDNFFDRAYTMDPIDTYYGKPPGYTEKDSSGKTIRRTQPSNHGRLEVPDSLSLTAFQAGATIDAIKNAKQKNKPFNITCSFHFPHAPMLPTKAYHGLYPPEDMSAPASMLDPMRNSPYIDANGRRDLPEYRDINKLRYMISNYYGLVKEIDDWTGKILDTLSSLGMEEDTLVIFTSDHGEMLGSHGMREKNNFYEESVHIPLIIKFPGKIKPGTVVEEPVSLVDLFATILDYLNAGKYPSDGESLRGLIEGSDKKERFAVSEWDWRGDSEPNFMVCTKDFKFFCPYTPQSNTINVLYDLKNDPHEMNNLIGNNPEKSKYKKQAEKMKEMLVAWLEKTGSAHLKGVKDRPVI